MVSAICGRVLAAAPVEQCQRPRRARRRKHLRRCGAWAPLHPVRHAAVGAERFGAMDTDVAHAVHRASGICPRQCLAEYGPWAEMNFAVTLRYRTGQTAPARSSHRTMTSDLADCCPELIVVHGISLPPGKFRRARISTSCLRTGSTPASIPYFAEIEGSRSVEPFSRAPRWRSGAVRAGRTGAPGMPVVPASRVASAATISRWVSSSKVSDEVPYEAGAVCHACQTV